MIKALDISAHQSTFDAGRAKAAGIGLVVCRAAYGTAKDTRWDRFTTDIRAAGLPLAAYGFLTAHYKSLNKGSLAAARPYMHKQVDGWIAQAKAAGAIWLAVDEEAENAATGKVLGLSRADNTTLLIEACDRISFSGLVPRLYCGAAWAMANIDRARFNRKYWIAYYYRDPHDPDFLDGSLPGGKYGDFMRSLGGDLAGWQFGRIGLGPKYGAGSANLDRNYFYDMEDKPMEFTKIDGKVLRCTSAAKPKCETFSAPDVNASLGVLELGESYEIIAKGPSIIVASMTGTWHKILVDGSEVYCLDLPDGRCVVEDKPVEPEQPGPEVPGKGRITIVGATGAQRLVLEGLVALWGLAIEE